MSALSSRRWHRLHQLLLLGLIVPILAACADLSDPTPVAKRTPIPGSQSRTPTPVRPAVDPDDQTWLILLYSDADDEILEEDMYNDLNEAEMIGSTDRMTVVAQMDRYDGGFDGDGDWTSTKRFLLQQDDDLEQLNSQELEDLGELNMADADTLIDFVVWAANTYPADRYVLIMSDHGSGWPGGWGDSEPSTLGRHDIPLAESFGDMLFLMEMGEALEAILAETTIGQFELIGFDACLMSGIEVYSAIAPYARYSVASQEVEPTLGWAYAAFLGRLADSPEIGGDQLAAAIVDSYIEQDQQILDDDARAKYVKRVYENGQGLTAEDVATEELKEITLTSVDLATMPDLIDALDRLLRTLVEVTQKDVAAARRYSRSFESVFDEDEPKPYIDLGSFARLLQKKVDDPAVNAAADDLIAAIGRTVIDEKHGSQKEGSTGISIHFPNSKLYTASDAGYKSYATVASRFVQDSLWDEFLAFHYKKKPFPSIDEVAPIPDTTPDSAVAAPGAAPITVAPVTLSASSVTRRKPVLLESSVPSANIAFLYIFIGSVDLKTGDIRVVDMDYLDPEATREADGVFYPDWGSATKIAIEFEWDSSVFALSDGKKSVIAQLSPASFGASPEEATYTVEGSYKTAKGKTSRRAMLVLSDGELIQVLGYSGKDGNGPMREITPKRGDSFTIAEQWITSGQDGEADFTRRDGETLVFGADGLFWEEAFVPKGEYLVGFFAEDFDGTMFIASETITVK
ncbi:MAG: hypothetical protein H0T53_12070 [Herpetosiphonaceae bacterium]|nr:hypothetical protein [Herpetosiphonaceae bacterium]